MILYIYIDTAVPIIINRWAGEYFINLVDEEQNSSLIVNPILLVVFSIIKAPGSLRHGRRKSGGQTTGVKNGLVRFAEDREQ